PPPRSHFLGRLLHGRVAALHGRSRRLFERPAGRRADRRPGIWRSAMHRGRAPARARIPGLRAAQGLDVTMRAESLSEIIGTLYDCVLEPQPWNETLPLISA